VRSIVHLALAALATAAAPAPHYVKPVKPEHGLTPCPLVSRGHPVRTNVRDSNPGNAVDGKYHTGVWQLGEVSEEKPGWLAIDVGKGPSRLLLAWTASGSFNHDETDYGGMGSYKVETSANSTNGSDGTWKTVLTVTGNLFRTREHAFDFAGQRWVRLAVTGKTPTTYRYGIQLDEVDLHDASAGADDTWFFLGDSITAMTFDRAPAHQPSFAEDIAKKHKGHFPLMLNGGIGFEKSGDGLKRLPELIRLHPDVKNWAILYGSNDSAGNNDDTRGFEDNLLGIAKLLQDAGRVPVFARIPYSPREHDHIPDYNRVVDEVTKKLGLLKGPDLYAYFQEHPDQLRDGLHPNDEGIVAINRLWAEAVEPLYH
jgi:acyl-CoA thioesterase-1